MKPRVLPRIASALFGLGVTAILTGCPATWGFVGSVRALPRGTSSGVLHPISGAQVVCDGCSRPIEVSKHGEFQLDLGSSYQEPAPVVLHVTAPHYRPLDVTIKKSSYLLTEEGPASLTFILEPAE
jgi:hypothetical protein